MEYGENIEIRHYIGFSLLLDIDYKIKNNEWTNRARTYCALWLVNLAGRTLLYGPLKFEVDSVAKLFFWFIPNCS